MMIGSLHIDEKNGTIITHRDSYLLDSLSVASVRRPFLAGGFMCGTGFAGFAGSFGDLLYPHEIGITAAIAFTAIVAGFQVGQLKLLSRDLRGSELADVIWGRYARLNAVRRSIGRAMSARRVGGRA